MISTTQGPDQLTFSEILGRDAEFVYGAASWLPELVEVRAGGLIPIARQYPGAREFVEFYKKEFPVDRDGAQLAHKRVMFQWQDGKKAIVWPEELAPGTARFPTPRWSQRP